MRCSPKRLCELVKSTERKVYLICLVPFRLPLFPLKSSPIQTSRPHPLLTQLWANVFCSSLLHVASRSCLVFFTNLQQKLDPGPLEYGLVGGMGLVHRQPESTYWAIDDLLHSLSGIWMVQKVEEMVLSRQPVFTETLVSTKCKEWVLPFKELPN